MVNGNTNTAAAAGDWLMEEERMLKEMEHDFEDETRITARLIDLICEMTIDQQLDLLRELDTRDYRGGRSDYRRSRKIAVDYEIDNRIHRDFIQDISAAGVFIGTHSPPAVGELITLSFSVAKGKKPITITGRIVRSNDRGFAVDFRRSTRKEAVE
jgi:hypothetical protein